MLKVYGVGLVTKDVELKHIGQEKTTALATVTAVFKRSYKDKGGKWQDEDCFLVCRAWSNMAERLAANVQKGDLITIEGILIQDNWTTKEGQRRSTYRVRLDRFTPGVKTKKKETATTPQPAKPQNNDDNASPPVNSVQSEADPDIPF